MTHISRREFAALAAATAAVAPFAFSQRLFGAAAMTAQDVIDRIKKNIGVDWKDENTVDTFKAGDPETAVTGIVTTSMATLDVLQQAVKAGANFVITAAPTFYSRSDLSTPAARGFGAGGAGGGGPVAGGAAGRGQVPARGAAPGAPAGAPGAGAARAGAPGAGRGAAGGPSPATMSGPGTGASAPMPPVPPLPPSILPPGQAGAGMGMTSAPYPTGDPIFAGKNDYIAKHKLVVFRLTQHWNERRPDPRAQGLATLMGWTKYKVGDDGLHYDVPAITLEALASQLKKTLGTRGGIRAIGDPATSVRRIGLLPGYTLVPASIAMMPTVDVIVAGEVQEWESATYAQDVAFAGIKKGFISIGRVVNEAPGMQVCADWLKTVVPEVPVRFISAGDPYWRPL